MGSVTLLLADAIALPLADCSVDAIATDPPYGLGFMGREWDRFQPRAFQQWCEQWGREALRVLKPGGHMVAFGGTRTYHRMVSGLEDAGFEVRDSIGYLGWIYGSGFPKSLNVEKATGDPAWGGFGTALKPAWEPIALVRKPLEGTVAANVQAHGTGALNIDAGRIGTSKRVPGGLPSRVRNAVYGDMSHDRGDTDGWDPNVGRWPANVILDPEAAAALDEQAGNRGGRWGRPVRRAGRLGAAD